MTLKDDVVARLQQAAPDLREWGRELWVFWSIARGEGREGSDVDVLVEFARPTTLFEFTRLRRRLAGVLGRPVDLVTRDALKPQLRDAILREAIRAA